MAVCSIYSRCHVAGVGIPRFGSKFSSVTVLQLASSSVLLIDKGGTHIASGLLIAPNVVLCAAHSIGSASGKLELLLFFECDAKTAPGFTPSGQGSSPFSAPKSPAPPCTPLATVAQARELKTLETGNVHGLDYALLAIEWPQSPVNFPRAVHLPRLDYFYGGELLSVGHPVSGGKGEPTQATAGTHLATVQHGPHPNPQSSAERGAKEYTYTNCQTALGMSGGGVFNEKGNLVGIVTGRRPASGGGSLIEYAFLNLGLVVGKTVAGPPAGPVSERLKRWMGGGLPLLSSDPQPSTSIVFNPPLK